MYVKIHLLIIISPLLVSIGLCPKVIPLRGFHCISNFEFVNPDKLYPINQLIPIMMINDCLLINIIFTNLSKNKNINIWKPDV
jgi:hypothetical protein